MDSKVIGRNERVEKWISLLDKSGITKDQVDNIIIAHTEGPAVITPTDKIVVVIPSGFIRLAEWSDENEWKEVVQGLSDGA